MVSDTQVLHGMVETVMLLTNGVETRYKAVTRAATCGDRSNERRAANSSFWKKVKDTEKWRYK